MTDGRFVLPMAAATSKTDFLLVSANPTGAVAISMLHSWTKLLRETPVAFRCSAMLGRLHIPQVRHYPAPVGPAKLQVRSDLCSIRGVAGSWEELKGKPKVARW